jgi:thioredoxin 1
MEDFMKKAATFLFALIAIMCLFQNAKADTLEDALGRANKEGKVVMLELGSVGCIPCEQMKPVMQKLRDTYKGKLEVIFIDVREDHQAGRRFGVRMIPTQVFLDKTGKEFHRHIGFYAYEEIAPMLKKAGI